jgi:hypothetical protein
VGTIVELVNKSSLPDDVKNNFSRNAKTRDQAIQILIDEWSGANDVHKRLEPALVAIREKLAKIPEGEAWHDFHILQLEYPSVLWEFAAESLGHARATLMLEGFSHQFDLQEIIVSQLLEETGSGPYVFYLFDTKRQGAVFQYSLKVENMVTLKQLNKTNRLPEWLSIKTGRAAFMELVTRAYIFGICDLNLDNVFVSENRGSSATRVVDFLVMPPTSCDGGRKHFKSISNGQGAKVAGDWGLLFGLHGITFAPTREEGIEALAVVKQEFAASRRRKVALYAADRQFRSREGDLFDIRASVNRVPTSNCSVVELAEAAVADLTKQLNVTIQIPGLGSRKVLEVFGFVENENDTVLNHYICDHAPEQCEKGVPRARLWKNAVSRLEGYVRGISERVKELDEDFATVSDTASAGHEL